MDHGHFLNMGGFTRVSTEIHNFKEPKKPGRGASAIMEAAYISCQKDYERGRQRCELGVLTRKDFEELIQDTNYEFPAITAAEIRDRSKSDALSKFIAILQTTWFILQCIARGHQRLAVTELELVTLALASLNGITYAFWWHKPLCVEEPVRIYLRTTVHSDEVELNDQVQSGSEISVYYVICRVGTWLVQHGRQVVKSIKNPCKDLGIPGLFVLIPLAGFIDFFLCIFLPFPLGIIVLLKILKPPASVKPPEHNRRVAARILHALRQLRNILTSPIADATEARLRKLLDHPTFDFYAFLVGWLVLLPALFFFLLAVTIFFLPFFALLSLVSSIFPAVFGIVTSNTVEPGATHVPSFYAPETSSDKYSRMVVFAVFGVIFGGLHCIGWDFTYPTVFEKNLWRASSLAITAIPIIVAPIDFVLENYKLNEEFKTVVRLVLDLFMTILLFFYVPARLSLIAQAFALLRDQPSTAFIAVDWTKYIPHIF